MLFLCFFAKAQKTQIGVLIGPSYYYGDIVTTLQPLSGRRSGSIFLRYKVNPNFCFRTNLSVAKIYGSDAHPSTTAWQKLRNLDFTANIFELSAMGEYNIIPDRNKARRVRDPFIPYVFAGIGVIYYESYRPNPNTGQLVSLRQLQLDGTIYQPFSLAFPFGVGLRYYINRNWSIGAEIGARWTTTSQLDNIDGNSLYPSSEKLPTDLARLMYDPSLPKNGIKYGLPGVARGKMNNLNDFYILTGITLTYRIWPQSFNSRGGRAVACPRFY